MLSFFSILFGASFPLAAAYALGSFCPRRMKLPATVLLATGAALLSLVVFLLMAAGAANRLAFGIAGGVAILAALAFRRPWPVLSRPHPAWLLLAPFAILYTVHALAPEIQPDAIGYHLGSVAEALRLGGFSNRIGFYDLLPQGVEMLFAFGVAFGGFSAAKLIQFAFLVASVPLLMAIGKRLKLEPIVSALAAAFYVVTPVVGVSGTCAYNDAALVFFVLVVFYLLLAWRQESSDLLLVPAGLAAGFCYAIKITGLLIPALALLYLLWLRRWRAALILSACAAAMLAPWMIRAALLSGNPFAPLLNRFFPNPYFHIWSEAFMAERLRSSGVPWYWVPFSLTVEGRFSQGLLGPLYLLAPLGLLALRRPVGRLICAAALLMSVPWLFNAGARFLMPALPFVALALVMSLPRKVAPAFVLLHAILSWPPVTALYADPYVWRLQGLPLAAALRLEPEPAYLRRTLPEYQVAELIDRATPADAKILDLVGAATAYTHRDVLLFWHSALGDKWSDALRYALYQDLNPYQDLTGRWPEQSLTALRFRQTAPNLESWGISEVRLFRGDYRLRATRRWTLEAWPNVFEAPLAFDGNVMTRWAAWEKIRPGMFLEVDFERPQSVSSASLVCFRAEQGARVEFYGRGVDGAWRLLDTNPLTQVRSDPYLKRQAILALRRDGVTHILAPSGDGGHGPTGKDMFEQPKVWGVELLDQQAGQYLFHIL